MQETFPIIFEDDYFVAINKPNGILVHRTKISEDVVFVLQLLRKQLGYRIFPVHRLDRPTSGVLIFGKNPDAASRLSELLRSRNIEKKYLAVVRGYVPESLIIDSPLRHPDREELQEAKTEFWKLAQSECPFAISRYPSSRYSLVRIQLHTGRRHQIRRHFAHLRHPVIGDKRYGDCKHNKYFREILDLSTLLLHASDTSFIHPFTNMECVIRADFPETFSAALERLKLCLPDKV